MNLIRYLLSYVWFFILIAFVLAIFYFRNEILPANMKAPVNSSIASIESRLDITLPEYPADENMNEPVVVSQKPQATLPTRPVTVSPRQPAAIPMTEDNRESDSPDTGSGAADTGTAEAPEKSDNEALIAGISSHVNAALDKVNDILEQPSPNPDKHTTTASTEPSEEDRLLQARSSFWKGDMKNAENVYVELSANGSKNPDVYGELGNLYYMQGKWKQAGQSYLHAAEILVRTNQTQQLHYLLRVIQGLDPESADKLQKIVAEKH